MEKAWVGFGLAALALMAFVVWFLVAGIIPWLFYVLLAVAVGLVFTGFVMLALQDTKRRS